jgi:hypothetical protein
MACAPHLSFRVLVLSLIIVWMGCPSVGCENMGGCWGYVCHEGLSSGLSVGDSGVNHNDYILSYEPFNAITPPCVLNTAVV